MTDQLTEQQYQASLFVAQDRLTNRQIATKLGIGRRTLDTWKTLEPFKAAVAEHLRAWTLRIHERGIADRQRRLYQYNERWRKLQAIVAARAQDPAHRALPGGSTGFIARRVRSMQIGLGVFDTVVEGVFDAGLFHAIAAIERQAAQELGQWDEKPERKILRLSDLSREEMEAIASDIEKVLGVTLPPEEEEPHAA